MKKGCFLSVILIVTIIIGVGFYIVKNHSKFFLDFGRDKIIEIAVEEVNDKVAGLKNKQYVDSVKTLVNTYIAKVKKLDFEDALDESSDFFDKVKIMLSDQNIDSIEISLLKNLVYSNEESEKN